MKMEIGCLYKFTKHVNYFDNVSDSLITAVFYNDLILLVNLTYITDYYQIKTFWFIKENKLIFDGRTKISNSENILYFQKII